MLELTQYMLYKLYSASVVREKNITRARLEHSTNGLRSERVAVHATVAYGSVLEFYLSEVHTCLQLSNIRCNRYMITIE